MATLTRDSRCAKKSNLQPTDLLSGTKNKWFNDFPTTLLVWKAELLLSRSLQGPSPEMRGPAVAQGFYQNRYPIVPLATGSHI
jgi:hypothetical protein